MACSIYLLGNTVQVRARPKDGTPVTDASAWRLLVFGPSDTVSAANAMTVEDGLAVASFVPDEAGRWRYRVEVSAPVLSAVENYIDVRDRLVPAPP